MQILYSTSKNKSSLTFVIIGCVDVRLCRFFSGVENLENGWDKNPDPYAESVVSWYEVAKFQY